MQGDIDLNPFRRRLLKHGLSADARVVEEIDISKWQDAGTSMTRKYVLEVQPAGEAPFQVSVKDSFSAAWAPKRGDLLKVRFNPKSHKVAFDLEGDPRYDYSLQKQTGQWKPGETRPPSPFGTGSRGEVLPPLIPEPADLSARLRQLADLRAAGVITAEDYEAQKARILGMI
jgi:hypothetical protein